MPPTPDGWDTWSRHVLAELTRLHDSSLGVQKEITAVYKEISGIHAQLATLKVQAGLWGAVGAAIPVIVTLAIAMVLKP